MLKTRMLIFGLTIMLFSCQAPSKNEQENTDESKPKPGLTGEETDYRALGDSIVKQSFDTLSTALKKAVAGKGIIGALKYCNIHAYPITDQLSEEYDVEIRRTSLQYRNPDNQPDSLEEKMLLTYEKDGVWETKVVKQGDAIHYFKPIKVQSLCLNCHGQQGRHISMENYKTIKELYPSDQAIGYGLDDFRGLWHLRWD